MIKIASFSRPTVLRTRLEHVKIMNIVNKANLITFSHVGKYRGGGQTGRGTGAQITMVCKIYIN